MTRDLVDIDALIQESTAIKDSAYEKLRTKTTIFMLPIINFELARMPRFFVNAYIGDHEYEFNNFLERPIFLLVRINAATRHRNVSFSDFERKVRDNIFYVDNYYVGKEGAEDLIMYVFEVPAAFAESYDKFLESRFSEFQEEYKRKFPKNITTASGLLTVSDVYGALYKKDFMKKKIEESIGQELEEDQEYWEVLHLNREIFRYREHVPIKG